MSIEEVVKISKSLNARRIDLDFSKDGVIYVEFPYVLIEIRFDVLSNLIVAERNIYYEIPFLEPIAELETILQCEKGVSVDWSIWEN